MQLQALSLGEPRQVHHNGRLVSTGIYKQPVGGKVKVSYSGLVGDTQADLEVHGGRDKAVYVYTIENYAFWRKELGRDDLSYGQFGENFTVSGMPDEKVHVGDIYRIGELLTQVTQPRVPCYKLGIKMESTKFPDIFLRSGRVGFYLRVLREGEVAAGDHIELIEPDARCLTIRDCMLALVKGPRRYEIIERALKVDALSESWRRSLVKRLAARRDA